MENRIAELRKEKHWTLKELGDKLDIRDSTLSQYETGKRNPPLGLLKEIANIFNVSLEYLTRGTDRRDFPIKNDMDALNLIDHLYKKEIQMTSISELTSLRLSFWIIKNKEKLKSDEYSIYEETVQLFLENLSREIEVLEIYSDMRKHDKDDVEKIYDRLLLDDDYHGASPKEVLEFIIQSERIDSHEINKVLEDMKKIPDSQSN
jgi:Predicted transcriptional regulators